MKCPQCSHKLHRRDTGILACDQCGYVLPADLMPVALVHEKRKRLWYILGGCMAVALLVVFSLFQQVRAMTLLSDAQVLNQQMQFDKAATLLEQASATFAFPATKQTIAGVMESTKQWQAYQDDIDDATELMRKGRNGEAVILLKNITPDYPDYNLAQTMLEDATLTHNGVLAETGMILPPTINASDDPLPQPSTSTTPATPSSQPSSTTTPKPSASSVPKPTTPTKPSTSTAPKPSQSPAAPPSYIVTNAYCKVDASQAPDLYQVAVNIASTCQSTFPKIEQRLTPASTPKPHLITLTDDGLKAPAVATTTFATGAIKISIKYLRSQPGDMGLVVHELSHVVQNYSNVNVPLWITEGIADHMRFTLGYSTSWSKFGCDASRRYTSGYNCAAALLKYIERVYMPSLIKSLHTTIRANKYTEVFFSGNTGKSLEQLYMECRTAECAGGMV